MNTENFDVRKHYESTKVDRRTLLHEHEIIMICINLTEYVRLTYLRSEIKDMTKSNTSTSCLDENFSIGRDGQQYTFIYDKRDDFSFHITNDPFLRNIPSPANCVFIPERIRYAQTCPSYECYIWSPGDFPVSFPTGIHHKRLKSSYKKFYGRYGNLIKQYEGSLSRILNDIMKLDQLQWLLTRVNL